MDEHTRRPDTGRGWMYSCCGMLTVLLLTLAGWAIVLTGTAKQPLCWLTVEDPPLTARETAPPEGGELYGWNGYYEVDLALHSEGERTITLYSYVLDYTAAGRSGNAWIWYGYPAPLLEPVPVLPAGQTVRLTQLIEVTGDGGPETAFPLTVRLAQYDTETTLGEVLLP